MEDFDKSQEYSRFEALAKKMFQAKPSTKDNTQASASKGFGEQQPKRKTKRKS